MDAFKAGIREFLQPPAFFEALGVRYIGPIDGHDIEAMEHAFSAAEQRVEEGPVVIHVITEKGRGYSPAEDDDEKHLHDAPVFDPINGPPNQCPLVTPKHLPTPSSNLPSKMHALLQSLLRCRDQQA
jgi:1-deoxy-D-xylulose-5-phosphate synthase